MSGPANSRPDVGSSPLDFVQPRSMNSDMPSSEDASTENTSPESPRLAVEDSNGTPGLFPATHWSMIRQIQAEDDGVRQAGLRRVCACYWKPAYVWLRARGITMKFRAPTLGVLLRE